MYTFIDTLSALDSYRDATRYSNQPIVYASGANRLQLHAVPDRNQRR